MATSDERDSETSPFVKGDSLGGGRLRIIEELGRGGMGIVYRAFDADLERDVALKVLREVSPDDFYWLKHEFRILHGIGHPNLVRFYDLTADERGAFFTMELLDGDDILSFARKIGAGREGLSRTTLFDVFGELASGLDALHRAGKLHRDVKPTNVFVTRDLRVVLLDFGLAVPKIPQNARDTSRSFAGTLQYVAPEQIYGQVTSASDWYAFGATVYEALTDRVPFDGTFDEIVDQKSRSLPPDITTLAPWVPAPTARLVMRLLDPKAVSRPTGAEVLATLKGGVIDAVPPPAALAAASGAERLFGREREMDSLLHAVRTGRDQARVVHVAGPSGIGKSELVRHAVRRLAEERGSFVLAGRCHPQELVPYKALDGVIDELGTQLVRRKLDVSGALTPIDMAALMRLFPTLARVPWLMRGAESLGAGRGAEEPSPLDEMDPPELRRRAFFALRLLLARVCKSGLVVLAIDDLQWGDLDSLTLLDSLLASPGAPPVAVILSYRAEDRRDSPALKALFDPSRAELGQAASKIEIGPLRPEDGADLARALLSGRRDLEDSDVERIVRESSGSPLFVGELSRMLSAAPEAAREERPLGVREVIARRAGALPLVARSVLDTVSLAAQPLLRSVALEASGLPPGERDAVLLLLDHALLRETTIDAAPAITAYHDQVREAVVAAMSPAAQRDRHLRIARSLSALPSPDPARLAEHYRGAGDGPRAAHYAEEGGDRASRALAFDQAAELYRMALSLPAERPRPLRIKLAEALAAAGRGAESGDTYLVAAEEADASSSAPLAALELRRAAAEQYLHCGMLPRGKQVMGAVLSELRVPLPATPGAAKRAALTGRLRMMMRGVRFKARAESEVPKETLARLDALWGASTGLAMVDPVAADALGVRHLFEALEAGEPSRVLRCMGYEAAFESRLGGPLFQGRALSLFAKARALAATTGDPYDAAWMDLCESSLRWFFFDWERVIRASESAIAGFRDRCRGKDWEMAVTAIFLLSALSYTGRIPRLREQTRDVVRAARERGDEFAANVYRMLPHMIWLADDRPDHALSEADDAIRTWAGSGEFLLQHYHHAVATTNASLYAGDPWSAWRRLLTAWPGLTSSSLLLLPAIAAEMAHLRARVAIALIAAGAAPPRDLAEWTTARLRRNIDVDLKTIDKTSFPLSKPFVASVRAGVAMLDGRAREAEREWGRAVIGFAGARMRLYELSASYRLGEVMLGSGGKELRSRALTEIRALGVVRPERIVGLLTPV